MPNISTTPDRKPEPEAEAEETRRKEWERQDEEVAAITRTVEPKSDPPSRAGITGSGSGADSERG
jgi:hypothetical protein